MHNKSRKDKKEKVFPPTPGYVRFFDHKWYVAVDEQRKKVYFWDGKSKSFNFMYNFGRMG